MKKFKIRKSYFFVVYFVHFVNANLFVVVVIVVVIVVRKVSFFGICLFFGVNLFVVVIVVRKVS